MQCREAEPDHNLLLGLSLGLISPGIVAFVAPIMSAGCATEVWA